MYYHSYQRGFSWKAFFVPVVNIPKLLNRINYQGNLTCDLDWMTVKILDTCI